LETHGSDGHGTGGVTGFLFHLADRHPKSFAMLLAKLLPLQLDADLTSSVVSAVQIISIPAGDILSAKDLARLQPALEREHGPQGPESETDDRLDEPQ
jgi:hypothetical protein